MLYTFQGGTNTLQLSVSKERELRLATEMTKFRFVSLSHLLNEKQIKKLEDHTKNMNNKMFDIYLIQEFQKMGYTLKNKK